MATPQIESTPRVGVENATRKVKVLYILGFGRSGSTVLGDILGQQPGWFHTGELCGLWLMLRSTKRLCSCGAQARDCEFWREVVASAWGDRDPETMGMWRRDVLRFRNTAHFLRARSEKDFAKEPVGEYLSLTKRLYESVARVAEARVIVDSSKRPSNAALLRLVPGVDPYFVHLVRDARGVAYSKGKEQTEARGMLPSGPATSARNWVMFNIGAEMVRRKCPSRSMLVRYEDFAANPRETLDAILELMRENPSGFPFIDGNTVQLGRRHTLKGSPNRFAEGPIEIRRDDAWMSQMPAARAALVTTLALPLLLRYGYPVRRRKEPQPS